MRIGPWLAVWVIGGSALCAEPGGGTPGPVSGVLRIPLPERVRSLDPALADLEADRTATDHICETLYGIDPWRATYEPVPRLAAALPEISADGLTWRVRLRPGVRFADDPCFERSGGKGRDLVAADVVFSWLRLMDDRVGSPQAWHLEGRLVGLEAFVEASRRAPQRPFRSAYGAAEGYPEVTGLSAPDALTLELRLTAPAPDLVWALTVPALGVIPPEAVAAYGPRLGQHPVGTGPFRLAGSASAEPLVLEANPTFREVRVPDHAPTALRGRRLPLCARVEIAAVTEPRRLVDDLLAGRLERSWIPRGESTQLLDPAGGDLLSALRARGLRLEKVPRLEVIYDAFNFDDPVVGAKAGAKGRAIRRAMSLAVDLQAARTNLYDGRVTLVHGPILAGLPEFDPAFVNPWTRRPDETMAQARERARNVLSEAGLPNGKGVPEIQVDVAEDATDAAFFAAFQSDMAQVGLQVVAHKASWREQIRRQRESKFQMVGLAWGADYPAAQNFLQLYYGPNRSPGPNSSNYANPELDALYERALKLPAGEERTALYRKMQAIVVDDAVWIFRYRREQWTVVQPWVSGAVPRDLGTAPWASIAVEGAPPAPGSAPR